MAIELNLREIPTSREFGDGEIAVGPKSSQTRPRGYVASWHPYAKTEERLAQIDEVLEQYRDFVPLTVRQIFYRLVGAFGFPKTDGAYASLCETVATARRARRLSFDAIRDDGSTRMVAESYADVDAFQRRVQRMARSYERNKLARQPLHVEAWCEAGGMQPQLARVAGHYSIPVYSSGGFDSLTAKHNLAAPIVATGKSAVILHLGDCDPSGVVIFDSMAEDVRAFVLADRLEMRVDVRFVRVALTDEQVEAYALEKAPAKASSHAAGWGSKPTCQLDALAPDVLAGILESSIEAFFNLDALAEDRAEEARERRGVHSTLARAKERHVIPRAVPTLPNSVAIFPELGQAALRQRGEHEFAAWAVVHAWDAESNSGRGICARAVALALIRDVLGVGARQAQRLVRAAEARYWRTIEDERLVLAGQLSVARSLGVTRVTRAHWIPVDQFRGRGQRRAALVALAYRTDEQDVPTTRRLVKELTGVPATTQRRLDREHGIAQLVSPVVAALGKQPTQWYADRVAQEFQDWGFFSGLGARLYRRHGHVRSATSHQIGSPAAVRRLNNALKEGRPAMSSRGPRAYFRGEKAVQTWMRDKRARGRSGSSAYSLHPLLNYSLVVGSPGPKRHRTSVLSEVGARHN